jgi:Sulfatase
MENHRKRPGPSWVCHGGIQCKLYYYGESGWGLGCGFGRYDDDRTTLLYNLSRTLVGRAAVQPLYQNLKRYDAFYRRNAADLNTDIFRWLQHRPARPFYVYINYFDAHSPYVPAAPYDHRFGTLPESVVRRWGVKGGFRPRQPLPAADRQALIDGYDNSLAYLDAQIGQLVHHIESLPAGKNTIILITVRLLASTVHSSTATIYIGRKSTFRLLRTARASPPRNGLLHLSRSANCLQPSLTWHWGTRSRCTLTAWRDSGRRTRHRKSPGRLCPNSARAFLRRTRRGSA